MKLNLSVSALSLGCALALSSSLVSGQTQTETNTPAPVLASPEAPTTSLVDSPQSRLTAEATYSYVAPGKAKFGGAPDSDSDAHSLRASVRATLPLNEQWFVPVGVATADSWLEEASGQPIPDRINTLTVLGGLGYHFDERWTFTAALTPRLYRLESISSQDVGMGGLFGASFRAAPTLTLAMGLAINPDSEFPVIPSIGARWQIQTNLLLNLVFPRPQLVYRLSSSLNVFAGGAFEGTVFRADSQMGERLGQSRFNNALGTYRDIHLGAGLEYELLPQLKWTLEGGCSVWRRLAYTRLDQSVRFDASPYCETGLKYSF